MTITPTTLIRIAGAAAVAAGLLFVGVQINHPHMDASSIRTTNVVLRDSLKVLMATLALAGITGMYLSQVRRNGLLGFVGYLVLSVGYLTIMSTTFVAAFVLPSIAGTNPGYVNDVTAVATGGTALGDVGAMQTAEQVQGIAYLAGGLLFGIALYRARVLARWAAALLAVGGIVSAVLFVMPDAFYRLLAFPNAIAMIGLGYSLWRTARSSTTPQPLRSRRQVQNDLRCRLIGSRRTACPRRSRVRRLRRAPLPRPLPTHQHRRAGRVLIASGLVAVGSGIWMTPFYPGAPGGGLLRTVLVVRS